MLTVIDCVERHMVSGCRCPIDSPYNLWQKHYQLLQAFFGWIWLLWNCSLLWMPFCFSLLLFLFSYVFHVFPLPSVFVSLIVFIWVSLCGVLGQREVYLWHYMPTSRLEYIWDLKSSWQVFEVITIVKPHWSDLWYKIPLSWPECRLMPESKMYWTIEILLRAFGKSSI